MTRKYYTAMSHFIKSCLKVFNKYSDCSFCLGLFRGPMCEILKAPTGLEWIKIHLFVALALALLAATCRLLAVETTAGEALLLLFPVALIWTKLISLLITRYKTSDQVFLFFSVCLSSSTTPFPPPPKLPNVTISVALQQERLMYLLGSLHR